MINLCYYIFFPHGSAAQLRSHEHVCTFRFLLWYHPTLESISLLGKHYLLSHTHTHKRKQKPVLSGLQLQNLLSWSHKAQCRCSCLVGSPHLRSCRSTFLLGPPGPFSQTSRWKNRDKVTTGGGFSTKAGSGVL